MYLKHPDNIKISRPWGHQIDSVSREAVAHSRHPSGDGRVSVTLSAVSGRGVVLQREIVYTSQLSSGMHCDAGIQRYSCCGQIHQVVLMYLAVSLLDACHCVNSVRQTPLIMLLF
jgi:hypothetical protein